MAQAMEHPQPHDNSLRDLLKELMSELSELIRKEIALARAEMTEKLMMMVMASAMLAVAGLLAVFALGAVTAAMILGIATVLAGWLSALIVFAFYLVVAGILVTIAARRMKKAGRPVPEQTIDTLKEDVLWAKRQTKSAAT
jgi:uncharacterized membrane protein YqjE